MSRICRFRSLATERSRRARSDPHDVRDPKLDPSLSARLTLEAPQLTVHRAIEGLHVVRGLLLEIRPSTAARSVGLPLVDCRVGPSLMRPPRNGPVVVDWADGDIRIRQVVPAQCWILGADPLGELTLGTIVARLTLRHVDASTPVGH